MAGQSSFNLAGAAARPRTHLEYCFAGQPAPCVGYFAGDLLPCVCGAEGTVLEALHQVISPAGMASHVQTTQAVARREGPNSGVRLRSPCLSFLLRVALLAVATLSPTAAQ